MANVRDVLLMVTWWSMFISAGMLTASASGEDLEVGCSVSSYEHWHANCYYFNKVTRIITFEEAQEQCFRTGGNLASILSEAEKEYTHSKMSMDRGRYWIGMRRQDGDNKSSTQGAAGKEGPAGPQGVAGKSGSAVTSLRWTTVAAIGAAGGLTWSVFTLLVAGIVLMYKRCRSQTHNTKPAEPINEVYLHPVPIQQEDTPAQYEEIPALAASNEHQRRNV